MKLRNILSVIAIFLILTTLSAVVYADAGAGVDVRYVKVNGEELDSDNTERVELTEELDIKVRLEALDNVSDIEVTAKITGYEYADKNKLKTYDVVNVDDLDFGDLTTVELNLDVPKDMDHDDYGLIIQIFDRNGEVAEYKAMLNIQGADNLVQIRRVSFDPAEVVSGRALRTRVRLENLGEEDEDDLYVQVAIPTLGSAMVVSADVDELEQGELVTTEDLLLRIPECVKAGTYDVLVTVEYDDGYETVETVEEIEILENDMCKADVSKSDDKTVITPPHSQEVTAGASGASFPIIIKNEGSADKTYLVSVSGVESWGSYDVSTPAPYVRAGESEVVYVYVNADPNVAGQKSFIVSVSDGENSKDLPVVVTVLPAEETEDAVAVNWKQWMYAGIIVLLVLIVILGLAIGFRKVSNDEDDEEYY